MSESANQQISKPAKKLVAQTASLLHQTVAELGLFWRSREAIYLNFSVPMLGMALFVYLNREGLLGRVFGLMMRGLGAEEMASPLPLGEGPGVRVSPMVLVTVGLITYCAITTAFEGLVPRLVRERDAGILKRLGGTPLRRWVFLAGKALGASALAFVEAALIVAVGLVSADVAVVGSAWLLAGLLLVGTLTLAALGFIVGNLTRSPDGAVVAVHAIYIPMLLLCGAFVPVEFLPGALRVVARIFPLTYFATPFRAVLVEGAGLAAIGGDVVVLLAWMVASWAVAIKTFRWE